MKPQKLIVCLMIFTAIPQWLYSAKEPLKRDEGLLQKSYTRPVAGTAWYKEVAPIWGGKSKLIEIFFRDNLFVDGDEVRAEIFRDGNESAMDLYLLNDWLIYRAVPLSIPYDQITSVEPDLLIAESAPFVDWELLLPQCRTGDFRRLGYMIRLVRSRLERMEYGDDSVIEQGEFVKIKDLSPADPGGLNCSGFVKWLVDGLYLGRMDREIPVEFLKQKPYDKRGGRHVDILEEAEDPFFGLDWTRNLALAIDLTENDRSEYGDSDINFLPELKYFDNSGYSVSELTRALYLLAVRRPGSFYLGSVNQTLEDHLDLRKHYHVLALFPRINMRGELEVVIFESGKETDLQKFLDRYSDERIHLVELESDYSFAPGQFENLSVLKR